MLACKYTMPVEVKTNNNTAFEWVPAWYEHVYLISFLKQVWLVLFVVFQLLFFSISTYDYIYKNTRKM